MRCVQEIWVSSGFPPGFCSILHKWKTNLCCGLDSVCDAKVVKRLWQCLKQTNAGAASQGVDVCCIVMTSTFKKVLAHSVKCSVA